MEVDEKELSNGFFVEQWSVRDDSPLMFRSRRVAFDISPSICCLRDIVLVTSLSKFASEQGKSRKQV